MSYSPILGPVVALVAWSLVVCVWMLISRGREFRRLGVTFSKIPDGSRGVDLEGKADPNAQWKSHNYNHLMEQPTIFYAVAISLALMDFGGGLNLYLAWAYVAFRIAHSLMQATTNVVKWRFLLFIGGSIVLAALTIHALLALFFRHHVQLVQHQPARLVVERLVVLLHLRDDRLGLRDLVGRAVDVDGVRAVVRRDVRRADRRA